ncbi:MBL fold metallo-hydrolase [Klebsiella pneumoniae]|nr:MBL fold metallo-hydrolase [Klebsiella pneumoniae]
MKLSALAVATALFSGAVFAAPLTLQTYNPQEKGLFAVNSTLVSGPHEAVLFDAQFSVKDGEKLVEMIKKNGKPLSRIVITSGDPDFYFGLEPLVKAFPQAEVVATLERLQPNGKPHVVIANTTKGAGISFIQGRPEWHHRVPKGEEIELALEELKDE